MPARFLLGIFDSAYLLALTAWVGSILFFSFGVAPLIFTALGAENGGKFVRACFRGTMPGERSPVRSRCPLPWPGRFAIRNTGGRLSGSSP